MTERVRSNDHVKIKNKNSLVRASFEKRNFISWPSRADLESVRLKELLERRSRAMRRFPRFLGQLLPLQHARRLLLRMLQMQLLFAGALRRGDSFFRAAQDDALLFRFHAIDDVAPLLLIDSILQIQQFLEVFQLT